MPERNQRQGGKAQPDDDEAQEADVTRAGDQQPGTNRGKRKAGKAPVDEVEDEEAEDDEDDADGIGARPGA